VRGIANELGRSDFDVAKTLFGLESAGVIVLVDPGTSRRGRASAADDLPELVATAERALLARDLDAARAAAEQASNMHPHEAVLHVLLGRIHLAQGHASAATDELRRAVRLDPLFAPAHRYLGFALVATGRFAEAMASWDQWDRLASRSTEEEAERPAVERARQAARVFANG
jgi:cytochrome c-type biogenesis protein CcmH/NrfG